VKGQRPETGRSYLGMSGSFTSVQFFWNGVVRYAGPVTDHRGAELCHPLIRRHVGPRLRTLGLKQGTRARVPSTRQHSPLPGLACLPF